MLLYFRLRNQGLSEYVFEDSRKVCELDVYDLCYYSINIQRVAYSESFLGGEDNRWGMKAVSSNYERVLLHRIFRKLDCFKEDILPILAKNERTSSWAEGITRNCNKITNISNNVHSREKLGNSLFSQNNDEILVGRTGLEPATFCTSSRCPTELDYRPIGIVYLHFQYIATSFFPAVAR